MKKLLLASLVVGILSVGLASTPAMAAGSAFVKIPFNFFVKDKEMPAGRYEVRLEGELGNRVLLRDTAGGGTSLLPIVTRLADTGATMVQVIFDTAEGKNFLSEIHFPGNDGFALAGAPGMHTHTKVNASE
ncbi:MAG TPA: hypothetical protein PLS53_07965 [Thermoanaerobaculaceae bacterium]|nr:hypothetical protein [Thermoanaerobaculaceae bacterium]HPS78073.1 hypothetical protein [Thermoanaerobaculaceae bacterium]